MEFLKTIFGDKALTYDQMAQAIDAYNGIEANKENQIKIGNLGGGEYISKAKYDALQQLFNGKEAELTSANTLIADLKQTAAGDVALQGKVTAYETQIAQLQEDLQKTKIKNAMRFLFSEAKGIDIDYLCYKAEEKMKADGKAFELDENEKLKGADDLVSSLKTMCPNQFGSGDGQKKIIETRLPKDDPNAGKLTKEQFAKMGYEERLKLKQENEELFKNLTKN